jgi:hypothetical protein
MARYRVGPIRFGGGRRVSVTARAGPFGVTFGGRYKRRRSGGRVPVDGQSLGPSEAETRAALQMAKELWAEYCDYYVSLTPIERSIQDQWNFEQRQLIDHFDANSLRLSLLTYLCAQSVVAIGLFNFGKVGWVIFLLFVYLANQLYALKVSRFVEPLSEKLRESDKINWYVVGGVTLIGFMFLPILLVSWESPTINWLAFGLFNYVAFVFYRGGLFYELDRVFHARKDVYERLTTHGCLDPLCLHSVWLEVCVAHLQLRTAKSGRYFMVSFWFPFLHFNRVLKNNRLGMMPFEYIQKPFVPSRKKMPKNIPEPIYPYMQSPYVQAYRVR